MLVFVEFINILENIEAASKEFNIKIETVKV